MALRNRVLLAVVAAVPLQVNCNVPGLAPGVHLKLDGAVLAPNSTSSRARRPRRPASART